MNVKREMLPSTAQNPATAELHLFVEDGNKRTGGEADTDRVRFCRLHCAVRLTLSCSQLHAFRCEKCFRTPT